MLHNISSDLKRKIIIILQKAKVFNIDFNLICDTSKYKYSLIVNKPSLDRLKDRQQEHFFSNIILSDRFDFSTLAPIIANLIGDIEPENVRIITNSEWCIGVSGE